MTLVNYGHRLIRTPIGVIIPLIRLSRPGIRQIRQIRLIRPPIRLIRPQLD